MHFIRFLYGWSLVSSRHHHLKTKSHNMLYIIKYRWSTFFQNFTIQQTIINLVNLKFYSIKSLFLHDPFTFMIHYHRRHLTVIKSYARTMLYRRIHHMQSFNQSAKVICYISNEDQKTIYFNILIYIKVAIII